ncbi:MAG: recombinase family protein [Candidatus Paceibacteria bacterium]
MRKRRFRVVGKEHFRRRTRAEARGFVSFVSKNNFLSVLILKKKIMSKPKYFLYARKSTEDDDKQIMSIEAQLFELREFASKENLEILEEFQESKSAKTPGRTVFGEMMTKVEEMDGVGILGWHPDRLARNSIDGGRIIYAVDTRKIVSLSFPTFWFSPTPQGLFMLQVAFGQSKYYSDNLTQNVKRGFRQKLRRGEWLTKAPFGYVNNPRTRNIEPHPTKSKIVRRAFVEYANGAHGLVSLSQFLANLGVVTRNNTPLSKCAIKHLLVNRAYLGFVRHHGEYFEGTFAPIISPKLFEAVQKVLKKRERPRNTRRNNDFPFTGLFRCGECDSMFTAQWATGSSGIKYRYYRCTKKKGKCSQSYLREDILVSQLKERLQSISLCDESTDRMLKQVDKWGKQELHSSQSDVQNLTDKLKASESRLDNLISIYLDNDIPKELYIKRKDEIMRSTLALKEKLKDLEHGRNNWVEPLRNWVLDTKQANFLTKSDNFHDIKVFVQKVGTNYSVRDKSARFGASPPSEMLFAYNTKSPFSHSLLPAAKAKNFRTLDKVAFCAPTRNRT